MITQTRIRTPGEATVATGCLYHLLFEQAAGDGLNLKPGGSLAVKDATFTDGEAWANPGYMTTGADTTAFATLAEADSRFTLSGQSLVFACRFKKAVPAGTEVFVSSFQVGTTTGGLTLDGRADGSIRFTLLATDGGTNGISITAAAGPNPLDNAEHTAVFFLPRDNASGEAWMDGRLITTASMSAVYGKDHSGTRDLRIGRNWSGNAVASRVAMLCAYQVPKDIGDIQKALIADYLHRNPDFPLEAWHLQ